MVKRRQGGFIETIATRLPHNAGKRRQIFRGQG